MTPEVHCVAGLAYGDEGKGSIVDALVRKHNAGLVIRYNGGSQCAHNVVTPDGRHHTFAQFGSGSFVPGVKTHLSKYTLVNPLNMMCEEEHLREVGITDIWSRTTVSHQCLIITPYQRAVNRVMETFRQENKHGSCGQGIGRTREDHIKHGDKVLFAGDLENPLVTKAKLEFIRQQALETISNLGVMANEAESAVIRDSRTVDWICSQYANWPANVVNRSYLCYLMEANPHVVFEGAQGILLDEVFGQPPYNTWTDTTFNNAESLLRDIGFNGKRNRIGVVRTYFTRHGAGPFSTEDKNLAYPEPHNSTNLYQDRFRLGKMDYEQLGYALKICGGVDYIALNHMDVLDEETRWFMHELIEKDFCHIGIDGCGPTWSEKYFTE